MWKRLLILILVVPPFSVLDCEPRPPAPRVLATSSPEPFSERRMNLQSDAFENQGEIPTKYTCEGADVSVPLRWSRVPDGTRSFVLIVDDPDAPDPAAPRTTWVHWVLFDIPVSVRSLAAGASTRLPEGVREGLNDWNRTGWGGPCPPIGRHRYFHKLYALDTKLALERPDKAAVESAMEGHVLASAELVGTYQKH